jgi:hypothetical protein
MSDNDQQGATQDEEEGGVRFPGQSGSEGTDQPQSQLDRFIKRRAEHGASRPNPLNPKEDA